MVYNRSPFKRKHFLLNYSQMSEKKPPQKQQFHTCYFSKDNIWNIKDTFQSYSVYITQSYKIQKFLMCWHSRVHILTHHLSPPRLYLYERCSSPPIIFMAIFMTSELSLTVPFLCYVGGPRAECRIPYWFSQGWLTFSAHIASSYSVFCPPVLSPQGCSGLLMAQPLFLFGIALTLVHDLALGLVELQKICTGPPLKPVEVLLDGIPSHHHDDCITQLGQDEGCTQFHCPYKEFK